LGSIGGVGGQLGLGHASPDDDLGTVDDDLRWFGEPPVGPRHGGPSGGGGGGRRLIAGHGRGWTEAHDYLQRCSDYMITPLRSLRRRSSPMANKGVVAEGYSTKGA